jgi:Poly(R)-hydroxyalkanoic acid synthase subunit (PHA_synth_III_E)
MFQFMTPDKSQNFLQQIQQYNQAIFQQFPQLQGMMSNMPKPEQMLHNSLQTVSDVYQNFSEQFHKFMNPYFTTAPAGREKEISSLMIQVQDKLVQYYIKSTEVQQLAYETGRKAMEKTLQTVMQKVGTDFKAMPFDDFYNIWVDTMENDTINFFGSTEYSSVQGKVVQLGLEIKAGLEKQMEKMLAPLPVVPRSEMDALNKTVHELKRKIRDIEQAQQTNQDLPTQEIQKEKEPEVAEAKVVKTTTRKTTKKQ